MESSERVEEVVSELFLDYLPQNIEFLKLVFNSKRTLDLATDVRGHWIGS